MNRMFPLGLESHLSFYLAIYLLTLVVHVVLIAYVLAGSLILSWMSLFPGTGVLLRTKQPLGRILRDWMPFALSGAITAGVAPLLFVQILYRQQFYTANLLLGWRWMIVIPVLIAAFYLLYVMKSNAVSRLALPVRMGLSIGVAACFLFVAFCWTANHLLSLNASAWPEVYQTGQYVKSVASLLLRLLTWVTGMLPVMSLLARWQLVGMQTRTAAWDHSISQSDWDAMFVADHRRLGRISMAGLILSCGLAVGYFFTLDEPIRSALTSAAGLPWLLVVLACVVVQLVVWCLQLSNPRSSARGLIVLTITVLVMLLGVASLREIIRLSQANLAEVSAATEAAGNVGGFGVFVVFALLNAGLIAWCIWLVRPATQPSPAATNQL